jgi:hypothetical protein
MSANCQDTGINAKRIMSPRDVVPGHSPTKPKLVMFDKPEISRSDFARSSTNSSSSSKRRTPISNTPMRVPPNTTNAYNNQDLREQRQTAKTSRSFDNKPYQDNIYRNDTMQLGMPNTLAPTTYVVTTPNGQFVIPNFDLMSPTEVQRQRNSYETKFMQINEDWKHLDVAFRMPTKDEHISNIAVRYLETEKHLSTRTGSDFWFLVLCAGWTFIQSVAKHAGYPADGYVTSQIGMYKMYQSQLQRLGASSGFGTEWPPWIQVSITSCISLIVMVVLSKCDKANLAPAIMKQISCAISKSPQESSEEGTPKPDSGGIMDIVSQFMGGGSGDIGDLFSSVTGLFGGGNKKPKRSAKKKKADAANRKKGPSLSLDDI